MAARIAAIRAVLRCSLLFPALLCQPAVPVRAEIVPGRVVVGLASGAGSAPLAARARAWGLAAPRPDPSREAGLAPLGAVVLEVPAGTERSWAARLRDEPGIRYAEPDALFHAAIAPSDSLYPRQWHLRNSGQLQPGTAGHDLGAEPAWNRVRDSGFLLIGVLDSGSDFAHPDLGTNLFRRPVRRPPAPGEPADPFPGDTLGWNFISNTPDPTDDFGHGTGVAGVLGALGDNRRGVAGVLWRTQLLSVKVLGARGTGSGTQIAAGVVYAVDSGARILNLSVSGEDFSTPLRDALAYARDRGALAVLAAGNDGANLDVSPRYPASFDLDNLVVVGASDLADTLLLFSGRGSRVTLSAPGIEIWTTKRGGGYEAASGTSFAAPQAAAAAALYWTLRPWENYRQVMDALAAAVKPVEGLAGKVATGGRLDLAHLVDEALGDSFPPARAVDLAPLLLGVNRATCTLTAPGEDGRRGRAAAYEARWSTAPLGEASFDTAQPVVVARRPAFGGSRDTVVFSGLPPRRTVHLALRALDRYHTRGPVSNDVVVTLQAPPTIMVSPASLAVQVSAGANASRFFRIHNLGDARLDGSLPPFDAPGVAWGISVVGIDLFKIAAHDSARVRVDVDATDIAEGSTVVFRSEIRSNDPESPRVPFEVSVTATAPKTSGDRDSAATPGGVAKSPAIAGRAEDYRVTPMPMAPGAAARFRLGASWAAVAGFRARVLDVAGREAARLEAPAAGRDPVLEWGGRLRSGVPAASGIYFLEVGGAGRRQVTRFLRLR
ncbi:MAG: S8 family serine peptidase [Candidatus Eisenbacteria bacterium]|nr:S8 family serine peptidase [Candidatus Eisenbacteria bacterium]